MEVGDNHNNVCVGSSVAATPLAGDVDNEDMHVWGRGIWERSVAYFSLLM